MRHSPLHELQEFVSLFRPKRVVPNTLLPGLGGLDWLAMDGMFSQCLSSTSHPPSNTNPLPGVDVSALAIEEEDITLKNLEGPGAIEVASRWADDVNTNSRQGGKLIRILEYLLPYLPAGGRERMRVSSFLHKQRLSSTIARKDFPAYGDDTDSDDSAAEEERGRTAHRLFADGNVGMRAGFGSFDSSSTADDDSQPGAKSPPKGGETHRPLTPPSSDPRKGKSKVTEETHEFTPLPAELTSPINLLPPFEQIPLGATTLPTPTPLIDLRNTLGKRTSPSHSSPSSQPSASPRSPITQSGRRKRPKVGSDLGKEGSMENLEMALPSGSRNRPRMAAHTNVLGKSETSMELTTSQRRHSSHLSAQSRSSTFSHLSFSAHSRVGSSTSSDLSLKAERLRIAELLAQARPDLVAPTYHKKRTQKLSWITKTQARDQYLEGVRSLSRADTELTLPWEDSDANDSGMDLERSRVLTEMVRQQVERKEDITLPALECLDSQQQPPGG